MMYCRIIVLALICVALAGCRSSAPAPPPPLPAVPSTASAPSLAPVEERARLVAALVTSPDDPSVYLRLALFDRSANNLSGAEQTLKALRKKFPRFFEGVYQLGLLYLHSGRNAEAIAPLQAAVVLRRDHAEAWTMLGLAHFRSGHYPEALQAAQAAIRIDPKEAAPYLLLARIYSNRGTAQQTMDAVQAYLKRSNTPAPGYYFLGRLYYRRADKRNAVEYLRRALDSDPENPDYLAMLGRVYCELGDAGERVEGKSLLEQALARRPNDWETHEVLGRALMRERRFEEAIPHFRAATQHAPNMGPLLYALSQALLRAGHTDEGQRVLTEFQAYREYTQGLERLKRAREAAPDDRSRHYALVRFCLSYRQYAAAAAFLDEAVRQFGDDATTRQLKARLSQRRP